MAISMTYPDSVGNKKRVSELRCALRRNALGVRQEELTFSWAHSQWGASKQEALYSQVSYRIIVRSISGESIYDSGEIESDRSSGVRISAMLPDNVLCKWKVICRFSDGDICESDEEMLLYTALGDKWASTKTIWASQDNDFCFLRSEFTCNLQKNGGIAGAILCATALSPEKARQYVYNIYINSHFVGCGPMRIDGSTLYYNCYDVTKLLQNGENVIASVNYSPTDENNRKGLLCQLMIFYHDGTSEILLNSGRDAEAWRALDGDAVFRRDNSIGTMYYTAAAENTDCTLYPFGFCEAGGDFQYTERWTKCEADDDLARKYTLAPYPAETMTRYEEAVASVTRTGEDSYFIDLGHEIIGGLLLRLDVEPRFEGNEIELVFGEELDAEGNVIGKMRTGNCYSEVVRLKAGHCEISNIGMKAFRYVEVRNCPLTLGTSNVFAHALRQPFDDSRSGFNCSEQLLNEMYEMTKYTIKATNQDLYVDSQSRERGAYEGDALINMLSAYAVSPDYSLARVTIRYLCNNRTWPAEYALFMPTAAWLDYMYTGDDTLIKELYTVLQSKLPQSHITDDGAIPVYENNGIDRVLVDWPPPERDGYAYDEARYNTVLHAVAARAYEDMASIASVLGYEQDYAEYAQTARNIKSFVIKNMYNEQLGAMSDGLTADGTRIEHYSQHASAYALWAHIYDDTMPGRKAGDKNILCRKADEENILCRKADEENILCRLAEYVASFKTSNGSPRIKMSVYGAYFMLEGLYEAGRGDIANEMLLCDDEEAGTHTWAYMMHAMKATVSMEAWSVTDKPNATFSHPWGSAPASQIVRGIFGIRPTAPGWQQPTDKTLSAVIINPQTKGIACGEITVPTIKGRVRVSFNN